MSRSVQKIALLWDIDGTLLNTKGVAAKQLVESFRVITGKESSISPGQYSGFTDYEIVLDLLRKSESAPEIETAEEILIHYGSRLLTQLQENPPQLLADIQKVFEETAKLRHIEHFIGTGNSSLGATSKLTASGLNGYFGPNSFFISTPARVSRDSVIQSAAQSLKIPTLLIGDSDRDILSAHKNNLRVLAVATGHHKIEELKKLKPDYLLDNNWNVHEFLEIISDFERSVGP
ncbi:HAD family hydrolase [Candidatus Planktophila dulcis]|uniref:HAD family hydrolase n=1 Tax=Candidatus Planktophila dulcis TaxID=1884914 RepID=UPI000BACAF54|nr:HAD hydrolase-like protein [Candidatus Planktophila dulcis]